MSHENEKFDLIDADDEELKDSTTIIEVRVKETPQGYKIYLRADKELLNFEPVIRIGFYTEIVQYMSMLAAMDEMGPSGTPKGETLQ